MMRKKRFLIKTLAYIFRIGNYRYKSNRNFFKKKLIPSQILNKILIYSYFFLFFFKRGGRFFRNQIRLFFLGISLKSQKFKRLLRRQNKNSNITKEYNKKIFKDVGWIAYNQIALKKKKSYFDLLESYYCWKIPIIFYEKRNLNFKKKKSSNVWSIFDLKIWGREVFNLSSKSFFQIFEFEKKENVVQKNTDILNSYYNSKYRRYIIKKILSKVTIDEDFSKNFLRVFPYTESFFERDLLFLIKHLKYLSPEKFDDFLDYDQLLNKPGLLYLLKKWELYDFFKKEKIKRSRKYNL